MEYLFVRNHRRFKFSNESLDNSRLYLEQRSKSSYYTGGRFLSECEATYLAAKKLNDFQPWNNLNDVMYDEVNRLIEPSNHVMSCIFLI
jgi:hypothetical protein